jgi:hypothetical protein
MALAVYLRFHLMPIFYYNIYFDIYTLGSIIRGIGGGAMAFTIEFLYEDDGELKAVRALDDEVLDEDKIRSIMKLRVFDTISLGSSSEKRTYQVEKINRKVLGNDMHFDFLVKEIPDE